MIPCYICHIAKFYQKHLFLEKYRKSEMDYSDRKNEPNYMAMSYRSQNGYVPQHQPIVEEELQGGCCNYTNQFYLMTSFAGTFACVVIFQVVIFF